MIKFSDIKALLTMSIEIQNGLNNLAQNSFRDTVIEILTEYKISLDEFKIIIK
ncbi:MAG: hypothetical protein LLF98_04420 [Clostridium sp.]|uniref:hypothetical protein n=1 Tax=Clostridium sp. TaxID=1506 RepID=UPI0025C322F3|nr:hypothetical protein [Clostridium sp.]MCE5220519.1 hypothetical protein [Clostridium sp.]